MVELRAVYDGEDLPWVAERWRMTIEEAVAVHAGSELRAAFCGFAPGFAYLVGLPERCHLPRRPSPRPRVPAGAVASAAGFTAVYPRPSPGGWHLIGRTDAVLWDPHRPEPALLAPGYQSALRTRGRVTTWPGSAMLEVIRAGALTTVQDLGRPGHAHLGVPRSGALDRAALVEANRLVGNPEGAAGLETTVTGAAIRAVAPVVVAVAGAEAPVTVDGQPAPTSTAMEVGDGRRARRGAGSVGSALLRRRGRWHRRRAGAGQPVDRPPVGSRAPRAARRRRPAVGPTDSRRPWSARPGAARPRSGGPELTLAVTLGPRDDWFTPDALATLLDAEYRVSSVSNRIALRLEGPPLARANDDELPSEGLVLGAVQVPAGGQPLVFLADHPTTGGYPVVAVVRDDDIDGCAQARPGCVVRFALV